MLQALQHAQAIGIAPNHSVFIRGANENNLVDHRTPSINTIREITDLPATHLTDLVVTGFRHARVFRTTTPYAFDTVQTFGDQNELYFVPRDSFETPSTAEITEHTAESEQTTIILDAEPTEYQTAEADGELVDDSRDDDDSDSSTALAGIAAQFDHIDFERDAIAEEGSGVGRVSAYDARECELEKTMVLLMRGLRREEFNTREESGMREE